jgi:hypothetical protein
MTRPQVLWLGFRLTATTGDATGATPPRPTHGEFGVGVINGELTAALTTALTDPPQRPLPIASWDDVAGQLAAACEHTPSAHMTRPRQNSPEPRPTATIGNATGTTPPHPTHGEFGIDMINGELTAAREPTGALT